MRGDRLPPLSRREPELFPAGVRADLTGSILKADCPQECRWSNFVLLPVFVRASFSKVAVVLDFSFPF